MKSILFFFCFWSLLFLNCNYKKVNKSETKVVFKTKLSKRQKHSGFYYDKIMRKQFAYFGDVNTKKNLKIFNLNGELKKEISFKPVLKFCSEIDDFQIISLDSIILLSKFSNEIFLINSDGEIIKDVKLNNYIKFPNNDIYSIRTTFYGDFLAEDGTLALATSWQEKNNDTIKRDKLSDFKFYYYHVWKSPTIVTIRNVFSDSLTYKFGAIKYKYLFPNDSTHLFSELSHHAVINNNLFCFSQYSNKILKYNIKTLKLEKEIIIKNEKYNIGIPPININSYENFSEMYNAYKKSQKSYKFPILLDIYFDRFKKYYYIYVRPSKLDNTQSEDIPWIVYVYNEKFEKIREHKFDFRQTKSYTIITKDGVLLNDNIKIKNINHHEDIYTLYQF